MDIQKFSVKNLTAIGAIISGAAIPISTAAQNIGAALLLLLFILTPRYWSQAKKICMQPFPLMGIILSCMLAVGTLWSSANLSVAWGFFIKMRAYYLIPVFFIAFQEEKNRNYFLSSYAAATCLSILLSCISAWFNYPIFKAVLGDWFIFRTHTYHNFFAALLGIAMLSFLLSKDVPEKFRICLVISFIIASYDILFLVSGRTGQILYVLMIILILFLWNWRRGLIISLLLTSSLAIILPKYSPAVNSGLNNTNSELTSYSKGDSNTPIGLRLEWQKNSLHLIKERPFFGHGTGSFKGEYERMLGSGDKSLISQNPHNDYLWLSVELGVFGAAMLVLLLISAAWQGRRLNDAWKWSLYAMLFGMGIATLANSFFTDNITGLAFVILTSAILNGPKKAASNI